MRARLGDFCQVGDHSLGVGVNSKGDFLGEGDSSWAKRMGDFLGEGDSSWAKRMGDFLGEGDFRATLGDSSRASRLGELLGEGQRVGDGQRANTGESDFGRG